MNFLTYIKSNFSFVYQMAYILEKAVKATPEMYCKIPEHRMQNDHLAKLCLQENFPEKFESIVVGNADMKFLSSGETFSMKKQQELFPRPWKKNSNRFTKGKEITIINSLGLHDNILLNADYVVAYQPTIEEINQKFTIGIMTKEKVNLLMIKKGDQWKIQPTKNDWDYLEAFDLPKMTVDTVEQDKFIKEKHKEINDDLLNFVKIGEENDLQRRLRFGI